MTAQSDLAGFILGLERRIEQLDRRLNNVVREARVTEVDPARALAKVEAHGLASAWCPWLERAGAIRTWSPPTVGERVLLLSPSGEPGLGLILPGGYSDAFGAPHDQAGEFKQTIGDASVLMRDGELKLTVDNVSLRVTRDGAVVKRGDTELALTDGRVDVVAEAIGHVGETHLDLAAKGERAAQRVRLDAGLSRKSYGQA
jgi:phage baseplate assembly protein V